MSNAVDDVWRFVTRARLAGGLIVNDWHLRVQALPGAIDQATMQEMADDLKELFRVHQNVALVYESWSARKVRGDLVTRSTVDCTVAGGEAFEGNHTGTLAGTSTATQALPPQDAVVVTLKTGLAGRSRRGRLFMAGLSEDGQSAGTIDPVAVNGIQATLNTFAAANKPSTVEPIFEWGVWSETIASGCKPAAAHPHPRTFIPALGQHPETAYAAITEVVVRNLMRTQRRRQVGVGQ